MGEALITRKGGFGSSTNMEGVSFSGDDAVYVYTVTPADTIEETAISVQEFESLGYVYSTLTVNQDGTFSLGGRIDYGSDPTGSYVYSGMDGKSIYYGRCTAAGHNGMIGTFTIAVEKQYKVTSYAAEGYITSYSNPISDALKNPSKLYELAYTISPL